MNRRGIVEDGAIHTSLMRASLNNIIETAKPCVSCERESFHIILNLNRLRFVGTKEFQSHLSNKKQRLAEKAFRWPALLAEIRASSVADSTDST